MKTNTVPLLLLAAFAALLTGCSGDELTDASGGGGTSPAGAFTITVADRGGYASASGSAHTRAAENDYTTTFTAGDQIGVFAVMNGAIMPEVTNLCLTAEAGEGSGSIVWKSADGNGLLRYTSATYYAYYPYQENLTGNPVSAGSALDFFKNVISSWNLATDQGTYAGYTAQDLMVAQGTPSGKTLTFSMEHCMALVVLDLPRTKYTFDNQNPSIPDYIIDAPDLHFGGFVPLRMADGTYRYLVNPATGGTSLSGSYTDASSAKMEWQIESNTLAKLNTGKYKLFKVDENVTRDTQKHTLQVGDFFMKDGSLLAGTTDPLTDEQKANCIGIVCWVGSKAFNEDPLLRDDHPDCSHGLVVALRDAGNGDMHWSNDTEFVHNWVNTEGNIYQGKVNLREILKMYGYSNTLALTAYNNTEKGETNYRVLPCDAIQRYSKDNLAPKNSSDWYFPSVAELRYVCRGQGNDGGTAGRNDLNTQIGKVIDGSRFSNRYWSSAEHKTESGAWGVDFGNGNNFANVKNNAANCVRPFLAF